MLHEFSDNAILSCGISSKHKVPRHLCDALQPFVTAALTALFVLQLAGLAVIAFGLWLRFGGPMAEFATDKKSPELFFMGKLQSWEAAASSLGFILGQVHTLCIDLEEGQQFLGWPTQNWTFWCCVPCV